MEVQGPESGPTSPHPSLAQEHKHTNTTNIISIMHKHTNIISTITILILIIVTIVIITWMHLPLSGKDKGGPSKGGFLNYILLSYTDTYLCNEINGMCVCIYK